jgi:hypothetical protein
MARLVPAIRAAKAAQLLRTIGHHHHVAGTCLLRYAQESSWREDQRRVSNGDQVAQLAGLVMSKRVSPDFTGYWQRHVAA